MIKFFVLVVLVFSHFLASAQIIVTLQLPDPCASVVSVPENQITEPGMTIYPNPTKGKISIVFTDAELSLHKTIEVYNIVGDRLDFITMTSGSEIELDLSGQAPGIYIISVYAGQVRTYKKIIKF